MVQPHRLAERFAWSYTCPVHRTVRSGRCWSDIGRPEKNSNMEQGAYLRTFTVAASRDYLGCVNDDEDRALDWITDISPHQSSLMSVDSCSAHCDGYRYFGVQNGNEVRRMRVRSMITIA